MGLKMYRHAQWSVSHQQFLVNMLDPIQKCFGYSQLWPVCSQNWTGSYIIYMPDPTSRIQFSFIFPKKTWIIYIYIVQNRSGWPVRVWWHVWSGTKLVCRSHWARFLAGCNQSTTSFPLSDSVAINHRCPGWYYAKPTQIRFSSGWLCQVLAKQIRSRRKLVCKNHLAIASELIQIRCELDPACLLSLLALPLQLQWPFTIWPCPGVVNLAHCPDITVRLAGHKTPTYLLTYHLPHLLLFLLNN